MEYLLFWYCLDDESDEEPFIYYGTDGFVHKVRSKITYIEHFPKRTKIQIEGRYRTFWFEGETTIQKGDYVELHYLLYKTSISTQAWIERICKLKLIL